MFNIVEHGSSIARAFREYFWGRRRRVAEAEKASGCEADAAGTRRLADAIDRTRGGARRADKLIIAANRLPGKSMAADHPEPTLGVAGGVG